MRRHITLSAFVVTLLAFQWPAQGQVGQANSVDTLAISLADVVQIALDRSPEVAQYIAETDFASARHRLARASRFLPEFNLATAHAPVPGLSSSSFADDRLYLDPELRNEWDTFRLYNEIEVTAVQPLYTWGELSQSIKAASYGTIAAEERTREERLKVAVRAAESYFNLLAARELVRIAEETGEIIEQAQEEITRLLDEGKEDVDDADLFQVLIVEQEYKRSVVEARQSRLLAETALRRQLFLHDEVVLTPAEAVLEPVSFHLDSLDVYLTRAAGSRPEIARARAGLVARDALVDAMRSNYYPKLFAGARAKIAGAPGRHRQPNPYISSPFRSRTSEAGVGIRLNLNFAQTRARVLQAEAEREQVAQQWRGAEQLIKFEVEQAYRNTRIASAALQAQDESLRLSREWLRLEQINFDLELGDTENLVRAVKANLELQARYFDSVRRYNIAVLRLLDAIGVLESASAIGTFIESGEG